MKKKTQNKDLEFWEKEQLSFLTKPMPKENGSFSDKQRLEILGLFQKRDDKKIRYMRNCFLEALKIVLKYKNFA